jgi:hypothetical protein
VSLLIDRYREHGGWQRPNQTNKFGVELSSKIVILKSFKDAFSIHDVASVENDRPVVLAKDVGL